MTYERLAIAALLMVSGCVAIDYVYDYTRTFLFVRKLRRQGFPAEQFKDICRRVRMDGSAEFVCHDGKRGRAVQEGYKIRWTKPQ